MRTRASNLLLQRGIRQESRKYKCRRAAPTWRPPLLPPSYPYPYIEAYVTDKLVYARSLMHEVLRQVIQHNSRNPSYCETVTPSQANTWFRLRSKAATGLMTFPPLTGTCAGPILIPVSPFAISEPIPLLEVLRIADHI